MPTVPRYDSAPIATRPLELPDAQPESFGGGAIARGLGQAADTFAMLRDEEDRLVEDNADLELAGTAETLLQEYQQLRGDAAVRASGDVFEKFDAEAQRVMGAMRPAQRERFALRYARRQMEVQRGVASHADRESQALFEATFKGQYEESINQIGRAVRESDPETMQGEVNSYITEIRERFRAARESSRNPWLSPEDAARAERSAVSAARRAQLEALYAGDRVAEAGLLIEEFGDQFTEQDLRLAREGQKRATEQSRLNQAYTRALELKDPEARTQYIRGLKDGDGNLDAALQRQVRELVDGTERQERDAIGDKRTALAQEFDAYSATHPGVTPQQYFLSRGRGGDLEVLGQKLLIELSRNAASFDDSLAYAEFFNQIVESPEKFAAMPADEFYSQYGRRLSGHRPEAERMYETLRVGNKRGATPEEVTAANGVLGPVQRIAAVAVEFGIRPPDGEMGRAIGAKKEAYAKRLTDYTRAVDREVMQWSAKNGGKAPPDNVLEGIARYVAATQVRLDMNENAPQVGRGVAAKFEDLEDEVVFGGKVALDRLTPEQRLRAYVPESAARLMLMPLDGASGSVSLWARARQRLVEIGRRDAPDWRVARVAAAMLTEDEETIQQALRER